MLRVRGSRETAGAGKCNPLCKPDRTGSDPEPLGPHRLSAGHRAPAACRQGCARDPGAALGAQGAGRLARSAQPAGIRSAHDPAHAGRHGRVPGLHRHLRHPCRQEPAGRAGPDPASRHPAVGAGARLYLLHRRLLHVAVSRPGCGRRSRGDLRDLHQPSLEHDLQLLPVAAHRAARPRGSDLQLSLLGMAALLAARGAVRDAGPHLEHDDEHVWGVVFCCRERGDHGRRQDDHLAGDRRLFGSGDSGKGSCGGRLGDAGDDRGDHSLRPADVPPARRLGGQVPLRADRRADRTRFLVSRPAAAQPPLTGRQLPPGVCYCTRWRDGASPRCAGRLRGFDPPARRS